MYCSRAVCLAMPAVAFELGRNVQTVYENPRPFLGPASWASLMPPVQAFVVERARPSKALIDKYLSTTIPNGQFDQTKGMKPANVHFEVSDWLRDADAGEPVRHTYICHQCNCETLQDVKGLALSLRRSVFNCFQGSPTKLPDGQWYIQDGKHGCMTFEGEETTPTVTNPAPDYSRRPRTDVAGTVQVSIGDTDKYRRKFCGAHPNHKGPVPGLPKIVNMYSQLYRLGFTHDVTRQRDMALFLSALQDLQEKLAAEPPVIEARQRGEMTSVAFVYSIGCGLAGGDWRQYKSALYVWAMENSEWADVSIIVAPAFLHAVDEIDVKLFREADQNKIRWMKAVQCASNLAPVDRRRLLVAFQA